MSGFPTRTVPLASEDIDSSTVVVCITDTIALCGFYCVRQAAHINLHYMDSQMMVYLPKNLCCVFIWKK